MQHQVHILALQIRQGSILIPLTFILLRYLRNTNNHFLSHYLHMWKVVNPRLDLQLRNARLFRENPRIRILNLHFSCLRFSQENLVMLLPDIEEVIPTNFRQRFHNGGDRSKTENFGHTSHPILMNCQSRHQASQIRDPHLLCHVLAMSLSKIALPWPVTRDNNSSLSWGPNLECPCFVEVEGMMMTRTNNPRSADEWLWMTW
jgi:hypothetical protein